LITTPTFDCDPQAIGHYQEMVNNFERVTDGMFRKLLEEIAMISGAPTLTTFAAFCEQIGLNTDWWRNELHIYPDGAFVFIDCNDGSDGERSCSEKRTPDAGRSEPV